MRRNELTAGGYAELVAAYAAGEVLVPARTLVEAGHRALRSAQQGFLEGLPPGDQPRGFRDRYYAALLHAEAAARLPNQNAFFFRLIAAPLRSLPPVWPPGIPAGSRDALRRSWGAAASRPLPEVLGWEFHLAAARRPLGVMDLHVAATILAAAPDPDAPPLAWQAAAIIAIQARYLLRSELWPDARRLWRDAVGDGEWPPGSDHPVVQAMADPDDLALRLAMAALGEGDRERARAALSRVGAVVAPRLELPRRLLEVELGLGGGADLPELAGLEAAPSQAAAAALVMGLHRQGRHEQAAAFAADRLAATDWSYPWLRFLATWADERPSRFDWLRELVPA